MEGQIRVLDLYIVLYLILYCSVASARDDCVTTEQDGVSVLHHATKLVCRVKEEIKGDFFLLWDIGVKDVATVERLGQYVNVQTRDRNKYEIEWIEEERSAVLTIKKTTLDDDGYWYCNFMSDNGCIQSVYTEVQVKRKISEFYILCKHFLFILTEMMKPMIPTI